MSYLVLARKYRPRTFADVVGQEVATRTLEGALGEGRVGHAYLFTGPRGTGKTTSARILAKALNCERGPTAQPCGECERCLGADNGAEADIVEIDAASHTGVDHVRELREQAAYAPMRARFKIYIIDEVHMLSKSAFNALLKTLEEPPPHVKFLFATTELGKVPETILSRCQIVKLTPISEKEITARLEHVFTAENVQVGPGVAAEIARRARGGLRDALSLADQLLALAGTTPTLEDLERLAGEGGAAELEAQLDAWEANDAARALSALPPTRGAEIDLTNALLEHVRATVVVGLCGVENPFVEADPALRKLMHARAGRVGNERLQAWLEELLAARERMRHVPVHARIVLETALINACRAENAWTLAEIAERLFALEERLAAGETLTPRASAPAGTLTPAPRATTISRPALDESAAAVQAPARALTSAAAPATSSARPGSMAPVAAREPAVARSASNEVAAARAASNDLGEIWRAVLADLATRSASVAEVLGARGKLTEVGAARVLVKVATLAPAERTLLGEARNQRACAQGFARVLGREVEVTFEKDGPPPRAPRDAFTERVSDLFGGRIEDDA